MQCVADDQPSLFFFEHDFLQIGVRHRVDQLPQVFRVFGIADQRDAQDLAILLERGDQLFDQPLHLVRLAGQDAERFHARCTQRGLNHEIAFQVRQLGALQNFETLWRLTIRVSPSIVCCSLETLNRAIAWEVSGNTNQRHQAVARAATVPMQSAKHPAASQAVGKGVGVHPAAEHVGRRHGWIGCRSR